ncbi:MAG: thioredoxin family protein [Bacteroidota bacterium]
MINKIYVFGFALIAVAAILASATSNTAEKYGLQVGETAPDFSLKNVDGEMVSLSDFEDAKGFVVNFTCNTCPFAKMYEERIVQLQNQLEAKGYPVINIMPNDVSIKPGDSFTEMKKRAKKVGYKYYLIDEKQEVFPQYGASKTPHIYLLDKDLVVQYIGAIDDNAQDANSVTQHYVLDAVQALEEGKQPNPSFTKAIGCSIKKKA